MSDIKKITIDPGLKNKLETLFSNKINTIKNKPKISVHNIEQNNFKSPPPPPPLPNLQTSPSPLQPPPIPLSHKSPSPSPSHPPPLPHSQTSQVYSGCVPNIQPSYTQQYYCGRIGQVMENKLEEYGVELFNYQIRRIKENDNKYFQAFFLLGVLFGITFFNIMILFLK